MVVLEEIVSKWRKICEKNNTYIQIKNILESVKGKNMEKESGVLKVH